MGLLYLLPVHRRRALPCVYQFCHTVVTHRLQNWTSFASFEVFAAVKLRIPFFRVMTVRQRVIGLWRSRQRIVIFNRNHSWRFWNGTTLPQNAGSGYFVIQHHIPEKQNPLNHTSSWRNWGSFARRFCKELCGFRKEQGSSFDISELQWSHMQCGGWEEYLQGFGRNASRRVLVCVCVGGGGSGIRVLECETTHFA